MHFFWIRFYFIYYMQNMSKFISVIKNFYINLYWQRYKKVTDFFTTLYIAIIIVTVVFGITWCFIDFVWWFIVIIIGAAGVGEFQWWFTIIIVIIFYIVGFEIPMYFIVVNHATEFQWWFIAIIIVVVVGSQWWFTIIIVIIVVVTVVNIEIPIYLICIITRMIILNFLGNQFSTLCCYILHYI